MMGIKKNIAVLKDTIKRGGVMECINLIRDHFKWITLKKYLKVKFRNENYVIIEVQGNKMYIDLEDPGISRTLLIHGVHEKIQTDIMKNVLKSGMTVLDIGGNIGYYVLIEASLVGKYGKVYAIEPDPRNFKLLNMNIKLNKFDQIVRTYQYAISSGRGIKKFHLTVNRNYPSMLDVKEWSDYMTRKMRNVKIDEMNVETISVDDFVAMENILPDVIRMDIEGYEIEAIKGMATTLNNMKKNSYLFFEFHPILLKNPTQKIKEVLEIIYNSGFRIFKVVQNNTVVNISKQTTLHECLRTILRFKAPGVFFYKG